MSRMCKDCAFFNEDKKSDEKSGHYCSKTDDYVLANEHPCDSFKSRVSPLAQALQFAGILTGVSDYMGELGDKGGSLDGDD